MARKPVKANSSTKVKRPDVAPSIVAPSIVAPATVHRRRLAIAAPVLTTLLAILAYTNAGAINRWRYARMTTADLVSAARREPENLILLDVTGTRLWREGRFEAGRSLLVPVAAQHPDAAELNALAGRLAWRAGQPQQAGHLLYTALQDNPADADACYWSALFIAERGNKTKAEALLKLVTQLDSHRGDAWSALGEIDYAKGDFSGALECLNQAERLAPTALTARLRAKTFQEMSRYDEAEAAARQAVTRGSLPQDDVLLAEIIQLSPDPSKLQEAQGYLLTALRQDPNNTDTLKLLSINYRRHGDYRRAVQSLRRMLRCQPAMTEGYLLLSQSYRALGKTRLADACLLCYRQLQPLQDKANAAASRANAERSTVASQVAYARALLELGRRDLAGPLIDRAYMKAPDDSTVKSVALLAQGPSLHRIAPLPPDPEGDASLTNDNSHTAVPAREK